MTTTAGTDNFVSTLGADFSLPGLRKQFVGAEKEMQKAQGEYKNLTEQKAAELKPLEQKVQEAKAPEAPKFDEMPQAPSGKMDPKQTQEAFQSFMALSMIAGALTKTPMVAAMNNMTGAMDGWMKGNKEAFDKNVKEFEMNYKTAQAKNQEKMNAYKVAMEKHANDVSGLMNEIKLVSLRYEDPIKASLAEKGDVKEFMRSLQTEMRATQNANMQYARMDQQLKLYEAKQNQQSEKPQYFSGKTADGKDAMYMVKDGKMQLVEGSEGLGLSKPGAAGGGVKISARERQAANNLVAAANEGAQVISDLADLSQGDPLFANKLSDVGDQGSISSGVAGYMSRKLSTQKQQEYDKLINGLTNVLTRVQGASGYASDVTKGKMDAVRKTILAKEGATNAVGYQALAEANQIFIRGLEAISTNASLNDQQRALINRNIQDAAEAIPFTVKDAFDYGRANYKGTMKEFLESTGRKGRQLERIRSETPEIQEKATALPGEEILHDTVNNTYAVKRGDQYIEVDAPKTVNSGD